MRSREAYAVINEWWTGHESERFLMEIEPCGPRSEPLGSQVDDSGGEYWSYSLVKHVRPGDLREVAI